MYVYRRFPIDFWQGWKTEKEYLSQLHEMFVGRRFAVLDVNLSAPPVEFDFVSPFIADRRCLRQRRNHGFDELGRAEHSSQVGDASGFSTGL